MNLLVYMTIHTKIWNLHIHKTKYNMIHPTTAADSEILRHYIDQFSNRVYTYYLKLFHNKNIIFFCLKSVT